MIKAPAILNEDNLIKTSSKTSHLLDDVRPLYLLPKEPLAEEVLIPGFRTSDSVDCMFGFFSSSVLADVAPGLATYLASSQKKLRLIISPTLSPDDKTAIENGLKSEEEIASEILEELIITEDLLQRHTLKCLSWLIREGRIEIKIALLKDALFHMKVWLFKNNDEIVAVHGSSNMTHSGIRKNIEQITVSKSWEGRNELYKTNKLDNQFGSLWGNQEVNCIVIGMPQAIRERLVQTYHSQTQPTEEELSDLYSRAIGITQESYSSFGRPNSSQTSPVRLKLPQGIVIDSGPFVHQANAIANWETAGRRGILAMATGSGKTITALAAATRIQDICEALFIVVSAPYLPLISQWTAEVVSFGVRPVPIKGNAIKRTNRLDLAIRSLVSGGSKIQVVVVTENYLTSPDFRSCKSSKDLGQTALKVKRDIPIIASV